ncbi:MAG: ferrochelatase [Desulfurivibrio sp.]|nr:ferrochelatase [Desulfurivibrio sp.]
MNDKGSKIGVVLLNMGGPENLDEVEPFLRNLFNDREIIRLGPFPWLQKLIAGRIVKKRAPKSREAYRRIGGGSPLARISAEQGRALAALLNGDEDGGHEAADGKYMVRCAMRYWHPRADETLAEFRQAGVRQLLALPLYPHFSRATTGSSLNDLRRALAAHDDFFSYREINAWPEQPDYLAALSETIEQGATVFGTEEYTLVYSAHSLPVSFIQAGDPYLEHIKRTIAGLEARLGRAGELCFQSRSGPVRWLSPSTPEMLEQLAGRGVKNVLLVPISFISDHVETLDEIDHQYHELAHNLGIRLVRPPALNTHPRLIAALAALVKKEGFTTDRDHT